MTSLSVQSVSKRFGDFLAVDQLSLEGSTGNITGLLGPNGSGKTTAIRMILNIVAPDHGNVLLFGRPFEETTKDRIGYLPEERGLYDKMKVFELLQFFSGIKNVKKHSSQRAIFEWLERLGLSAWKENRVDTLSKGMQQKVQFIATVVHEPDLIILDEPFSGLDPVNNEILRDILIDLKRKGNTILLSTHHMEFAELLCDDICLINRGRKVLGGNMSEIKQAYGDMTTRRYVVEEPSLNDIFLKAVNESS